VKISSSPTALSDSDELSYRRNFLSHDARRLLATYALAIFFILAYVGQDALFLGQGTPRFNELLGLRVFMVCLSGLAAWVAYRTVEPRWLDISSIGWGVVIPLLYIPIMMSRPAAYTHNLVADLVSIMLFHLAMPDRPRWRVLPAIMYTLVSLGTLVTVKQAQPLPVLVIVIANFMVVNLVCIVVARNIARYRRCFWDDERRLANLAQQRLHMVEARNQLIATLSHEFRTPLNAVAGSAAILDGYHERLDAPQRNSLLARIQVGVSRLSEMLDQALFISRSQADRLVLQPAEIQVADTLEKLAAEVAVLYPECAVSIHLEGAPEYQVSDAAMLRLMVLNLVSNACKFTPLGKARSLVLKAGPEGFSIRVEDSGIGIPEDELGQIFTPFTRASNASLIQGMGLGLAIVKDAVERLNGNIAVQSLLGQGTTVEIALPWWKPEHV
jgi:signal transduction histidine kinase